jgi:hypothetical protein
MRPYGRRPPPVDQLPSRSGRWAAARRRRADGDGEEERVAEARNWRWRGAPGRRRSWRRCPRSGAALDRQSWYVRPGGGGGRS